jgi:cytochrome P450
VLLLQRDLGPRSPWGRFIRLRDEVDRLLYDEIARRRADPDREGRDDILTLLLAPRDEDGEPLSDRELRDELITLLLAGHETTATSIGWAFERLLRTPAALACLVADRGGGIHRLRRRRHQEDAPGRPVVAEMFRAPTEPTELGGYLFAPGAQLAISLLLVQYDSALYPPDPQAFRPERFLEARRRPPWVPFGGGVRRAA